MKTLQQEIVEALRYAAEIDIQLCHMFGNEEDGKEWYELAEKVESTHCTDCDKYIHDKHFPGCSIFDVDEQDVAFTCKEFKLKVK